jgi:hypothetical protein
MPCFVARGLAAPLAAWALLAPSAALAAPGWRLVLLKDSSVEACVREAELQSAVVSRLGYDPFAGNSRALIVTRLTRQETQLVSSVEVFDESGASRGKRELTSGAVSCDDMTRALALSISIALDPDRTGVPSTEPTPAPTVTEAAPVTAPRLRDDAAGLPPAAEQAAPRVEPPRPDAVSAGSARQRVAWSGSLTALSMIGVAPSPTFGAQLDLQRKWNDWALGVGARAVRSVSARVDNDAELTTTLVAAEVEGCFQAGLVEYCGVALLGPTWARAGNVDAPRTAQGWFGAAGARLGLVAPLSASFSVLARAEALAVAWPIRAQVDGTTVWNAPVFSAALAAGLRAHFR